MASRRIDPRVQVGAVHLEVADIDRAAEFYEHRLGLEITHRVGNSAVLTADGRHPLLYLTRRSGAGRPRASRVSIRYPDRESLDDALRHLTGSGVSPEAALDDGIAEGVFVSDPDGNRIELYYVRPRGAWSLVPGAGPGAVDAPAGRSGPTEDGPPSAVDPAPSQAPLTEATRARLGEMRRHLLNLHKVLLDDAKTAYELDRGRVTSNANLLQLVINDPWFAWLHPLSELVVRIDEALHADVPATEPDGAVLLDEVERLLSPGGSVEGFTQRYYEALHRQPAVIVAHAEVRRILKQAR